LLYDAGQVDASFALLEQAVSQSPRDLWLKLELAAKYMQHGRAIESSKLIDEVLKWSTDPLPALRAQAECQMYLRRPDLALESTKTASNHLNTDELRSPNRLNELAYYRALASLELEKAEADIDDAVQELERRLWWSDKAAMPLRDQTLIASAMVFRQVQMDQETIPMLDDRIQALQHSLADLRQNASRRVYQEMLRSFPLDQKAEEQVRRRQIEVQANKQFLAIFLSVRALLHQDLGDFELCNKDRLAVWQLDLDADTIVQQLPDDWLLLTNQIYVGCQFLDTRAMVKQQLARNPLEAINDLNVAVWAMNVLRKTEDGPLRNTLMDEGANRFQRAQVNRVEAVLRKHRADLLRQLGLMLQAESDLREIESLGFDREEVLF
jgi:hypothetical protein